MLASINLSYEYQIESPKSHCKVQSYQATEIETSENFSFLTQTFQGTGNCVKTAGMTFMLQYDITAPFAFKNIMDHLLLMIKLKVFMCTSDNEQGGAVDRCHSWDMLATHYDVKQHEVQQYR